MICQHRRALSGVRPYRTVRIWFGHGALKESYGDTVFQIGSICAGKTDLNFKHFEDAETGLYSTHDDVPLK